MRLTFFDTESTDLSASWGRLLCASFAGLDGPVETYRIDAKPWSGRNKIDDAKLAVAVRDRVEQTDLLVTQNGKLHDIPLLNARLALAGERPVRTERFHHVDTMYYWSGGASMKTGSKRLDYNAKLFKSKHQKTPLDGEVWQLAATGEKDAMDQVVDHCEHDVLVMRDLWPVVAPLVKQFTLPLAAWWRWAREIEV